MRVVMAIALLAGWVVLSVPVGLLVAAMLHRGPAAQHAPGEPAPSPNVLPNGQFI